MTLTEAGEGYYRYCQQIVENAMEAEQFVQTFSSEPQGLLRISAPEGIGRILSKDLADSFLKKYDKINMEIYLSGREVDLVRERFDIVLRASSTPLKDSSLIAKRIQDIELGFFVSSQYLAINGNITTVEQLEKQPFIYFIPENKMNLQLHKDNKQYSPTLKSRVIINDSDACISAIHASLGVGILPTNVVKDEIKARSLVQILPEYKLPLAYLYAIYPCRHWLPSKIKVFLEFIEQWAQKQ